MARSLRSAPRSMFTALGAGPKPRAQVVTAAAVSRVRPAAAGCASSSIGDPDNAAPHGIIILLERGEHFVGVSDRKDRFAILGPYTHYCIGRDLRHADAIANQGFKIPEGSRMHLLEFSVRDRLGRRVGI